MAVAVQPSRMTADELFERRDDGYRYELVEGSLQDVQAVGDAGELTGGDVLPGFRCPVRRLFPWNDPP
ncbi:MAG: hypothetical protein OXG35_23295 [Acidobacteria bacterium]|nr:hypothetical protein [Acidobacteriota bacterium]